MQNSSAMFQALSLLLLLGLQKQKYVVTGVLEESSWTTLPLMWKMAY